MMTPVTPVILNVGASVIDHSTALSCWCASESAQSRRYDAVCETQLRQNSVCRDRQSAPISPDGAGPGQRTDGVDDLVDHHLAKLKLLVFLA